MCDGIDYFRCLLTALAIWNISIFFAPKTACNLSSARISRLFCGFCSLCFLMCAQIFFVTSLRGSGSVPTILAKCSEGCIGFMNALFFFFALLAGFAIHHSQLYQAAFNGLNCNGSGRRRAKKGMMSV